MHNQLKMSVLHKVFILLLILVLVLVAVPSIVDAAEDYWVALEPMPAARSGHRIVVVDEEIYVMGGGSGGGPLGNIEVYDPVTDTWVTKSGIPTPRTSFGVAVVGNWIYVIGGAVTGMPTTRVNEAYNYLTDAWETKTQMPTDRTLIVAHAVDGKIYVMAGCTFPHPSFPTLCNTTEIYDPSTDSWTTGAPMPNYAGLGMPEHMASAALDNKIYIIFEETLYIYTVDTDSWSFGASLPTRLRGAAACFTTGLFAPKRLHVTGLDLHYVYDPETDNWTSATPVPNSRYFTQLGVVDDILYAIGGGIGDPLGSPPAMYEPKNTNEKYTPAGYIPEFPSWAVLPLLLVATLAALLWKKRLNKTCGCLE
jgi:N-acetylneuraminic acid mutarotase